MQTKLIRGGVIRRRRGSKSTLAPTPRSVCPPPSPPPNNLHIKQYIIRNTKKCAFKQ